MYYKPENVLLNLFIGMKILIITSSCARSTRLLLALEAQCTHSVIAHFINVVCCGAVHHCSHTHDDKLVTCYKDVSE